MPLLNNNHFGQAQFSWKIKLENFKQENVLLKYRLSQMVDDNEGSKFLQMAEYFQNELLIIDVILKKLFNKLDEINGLLREPKNENDPPGEIVKEYNQFSKFLFTFEKRFLKLTKEFNEKMLENTQH